MIDTVIYGLLALVVCLVIIGVLAFTLNHDAQQRFEAAAERESRRVEPCFGDKPLNPQHRAEYDCPNCENVAACTPAPPPARVPWLLVGGPAHGYVRLEPKMSAAIWIEGNENADHLYRASHWRALGGGEELTFRIATYNEGVSPDLFAEVPDLIRRLNFLDVKGRAL